MLKRIFAFALAAHLALIPAHVLASQNVLYSPSTGTVSGLQLTNNYNNGLDSLNTMNSGTSAPTNQMSGVPSIGNWWLNLTSIPYPAQVYDGADWLTPFWIDATNHYVDVKIGGGTNTIASAATVDLCSVPQSYITVSGTTTITSFGSTCKAGHVKIVTFSGALTLTYNAASLIIPGAANVTTAAGDQAVVVALGSGNWQVISYTPASGQALINPAIDVGAVEWSFSPTLPVSNKYLWGYGQAISRTTYATLLTALTITQSVTATNGSPTLTGFSDTTQIPVGAVVEASFYSAPTTIVSCTTSTCTTAANANASTSGNVTIFPYGDGCGAGTACSSVGANFNVPDCRGVGLSGRDNMGGTPKGALTSTYFGTNPDALGAAGGAQNRTLAQANLGTNWSFPVSGIAVSTANGPLVWGGQQAIGCNLNQAGACNEGSGVGFGISSVAGNNASVSSDVSVAVTSDGNASSNGNATPLATVPPTITANCMIRVLSKLEPLVPSNKLAANDDLPLAIERRAA